MPVPHLQVYRQFPLPANSTEEQLVPILSNYVQAITSLTGRMVEFTPLVPGTPEFGHYRTTRVVWLLMSLKRWNVHRDMRKRIVGDYLKSYRDNALQEIASHFVVHAIEYPDEGSSPLSEHDHIVQPSKASAGERGLLKLIRYYSNIAIRTDPVFIELSVLYPTEGGPLIELTVSTYVSEFGGCHPSPFLLAANYDDALYTNLNSVWSEIMTSLKTALDVQKLKKPKTSRTASLVRDPMFEGSGRLNTLWGGDPILGAGWDYVLPWFTGPEDTRPTAARWMQVG